MIPGGQLDQPSHLSRISTIWGLVQRAHSDSMEDIGTAQAEIIERYAGAVHRYLCKVLRNPDAADDVFQEFAVLVLRGGFRHADRERGRFRDYLKTAVLRLVADHHRRRKRRNPLLHAGNLDDGGEPADADQRVEDEFDKPFQESCREELLDRAWCRLKQIEDDSGQPFYTVLDYRARSPECSSAEMAEALTALLYPQTPFTAQGIRKTLQRSRDRFAELLLGELARMCGSSAEADLESELIDLGLLSYCRPALRSR